MALQHNNLICQIVLKLDDMHWARVMSANATAIPGANYAGCSGWMAEPQGQSITSWNQVLKSRFDVHLGIENTVTL